MNELDQYSPQQSPPTESIGQVLSAAREASGLSVRDVARFLNLGVATIESLEEDAFERLPGLTFTKGYLRSYARLLKLDEGIVDSVSLGSEQLREIPVTKASLKWVRQRARSNRRGGSFFRMVLLVGVLLGLAWVAISQLGKLGQLPALNLSNLQDIIDLPVPTDPDGAAGEIRWQESNSGATDEDANGASIRIE